MTLTLGGADASEPQTRQALIDSLFDGVFATVMIGLVDTFGVAGAVALGVHPVALALLGSLPVWLGTVAQLAFGRRVEGRPRKPLVVGAVRTQAAALVALSFCGWAPAHWAPWLYVAVFVLYGASNASVGHLWMSWFSDVCPTAILGRHAAWRSAIFACVQLLVALSAGLLTRRYTSESAPWVVFAVVFLVASGARFVSSAFLVRQYEPQPQPGNPARLPYRPSPALVRFSVAMALLQGAAVMAGPFFAVWFLRDLEFSYLAFASCNAATVAGNMLASPLIGKLVDRHGAARVLRIGGALAAVVPFPYLWIDSPTGVAFANFYSGAAWAAVNVAAFKYLLNASRTDGSRAALVYANLWLTSSVLGFGLIGGILSTRLPVILVWQLQTLFALSAVLRVLIVLGLFTRLVDLEVTPLGRTGGPGRFFQLFKWKGPGTTQV